MCKIVVCKKRPLDKTNFEYCWDSNRDGVGFAYIKDGLVHTEKGFMDKDKAYEAYKKIPVPNVIHFRIGTAGGDTEELTHPFICTPESPVFKKHIGKETILFHNGCLSDWKEIMTVYFGMNGKIPDGEMSDSRLLAIMMGKMDIENSVKYLNIVSPNGKFVLMNPRSGIVMVGDFVKQNKIYYSGWAPVKPYKQPIGYYSSLPGYKGNYANSGSRISMEGD